jgi:transposase
VSADLSGRIAGASKHLSDEAYPRNALRKVSALASRSWPHTRERPAKAAAALRRGGTPHPRSWADGLPMVRQRCPPSGSLPILHDLRRGEHRHLVHLQDRFRLTGYDTVHENSDLCTSVVRKGAREPPKGAALQRRLRHAPLAGALGERAPKIALNLGCASQTVRDAIHDFNLRGLLALQAKSSRPRRTRDAFDEESAEKLRGMLHRSPREFGYQTSLWTLGMASEAAFDNGLTEERVSGETIRATLSRLLGVRWMRAKRWITSPDPL